MDPWALEQTLVQAELAQDEARSTVADSVALGASASASVAESDRLRRAAP